MILNTPLENELETTSKDDPQSRTLWRVETFSGRRLVELLPAFRAFAATQQTPLQQDLEWLLKQHSDNVDNLSGICLYADKVLFGFAPVLLRNKPLRCFWGEIKMFSFPMRCLHLLAPPSFPEDPEAYDLLFSALQELAPDIDAIYADTILVGSYFHKYLTAAKTFSRKLSFYAVGKTSEHFLIKLPESFDVYLKKFSSKTRNTLLRRIRKLEQDTTVRLCRVAAVEDIDEFVECAVQISKKTYQWNLLGLGLRQPDRLREELKFLAERGWLRSYLLRCGDTPSAFMLCHQYNDICYYFDVGHDPDWSSYAVGNVLQLLVIKDLCESMHPAVFDFGPGEGEHKRLFGTTSYVAMDAYLFRPKLYTFLARNLHRTNDQALDRLASFLDTIHLKRSIKKLIRRGILRHSSQQQ